MFLYVFAIVFIGIVNRSYMIYFKFVKLRTNVAAVIEPGLRIKITIMGIYDYFSR